MFSGARATQPLPLGGGLSCRRWRRVRSADSGIVPTHRISQFRRSKSPRSKVKAQVRRLGLFHAIPRLPIPPERTWEPWEKWSSLNLTNKDFRKRKSPEFVTIRATFLIDNFCQQTYDSRYLRRKSFPPKKSNIALVSRTRTRFRNQRR